MLIHPTLTYSWVWVMGWVIIIPQLGWEWHLFSTLTIQLISTLVTEFGTAARKSLHLQSQGFNRDLWEQSSGENIKLMPAEGVKVTIFSSKNLFKTFLNLSPYSICDIITYLQTLVQISVTRYHKRGSQTLDLVVTCRCVKSTRASSLVCIWLMDQHLIMISKLIKMSYFLHFGTFLTLW